MKQRKFLTRKEIDALLQATKLGRYTERDYCLLLMEFFHGFRISGLSRLAMNDVDLTQDVIYVRRLKRGLSIIQPLHSQEIKAIHA